MTIGEVPFETTPPLALEAVFRGKGTERYALRPISMRNETYHAVLVCAVARNEIIDPNCVRDPTHSRHRSSSLAGLAD